MNSLESLERRLKTANKHTEDAFFKLQAAVAELDILRRKLQKADIDREVDQETIDMLCVKLDKARLERDAKSIALKRVRGHLSEMSECLLSATTGRDTAIEERDEARFWAKKLMREKLETP